MNLQELKRYVGHTDQLLSVRESRLDGGPGHGVKVVDVDNGAGLNVTIVADQGMDMHKVSYKGVNLSFLTPTGIVDAASYSGDRFLERFFGGFLTTCGFENIGSPCTDGGEALPLHGSYATLKAARLSTDVREEDGSLVGVVKGTMADNTLFGPKLSLTREYRFRHGESGFTLTDTLCNRGSEPVPYMILYHFNLGYPLLSEAAKLVLPSKKATPRTANADLAKQPVVEGPQKGFREMCYYHEMAPDADGKVRYGIDNPEVGVSLRIAYDASKLTHFVQWRMLGEGEYVMGLEPCNATIEGRDTARADGSLKFLQPGETVVLPFEITLSSL